MKQWYTFETISSLFIEIIFVKYQMDTKEAVLNKNMEGNNISKKLLLHTFKIFYVITK